jgi:hypothetical protein
VCHTVSHGGWTQDAASLPAEGSEFRVSRPPSGIYFMLARGSQQ